MKNMKTQSLHVIPFERRVFLVFLKGTRMHGGAIRLIDRSYTQMYLLVHAEHTDNWKWARW